MENSSQLKIKSIKHNFVLNNVRLVLNFIVPVVIFPYIGRVLGPENLGRVEFANSIISYFVLFTALGIPVYGVREIARGRDDIEIRSKTVWELTVILFFTVFIGYVIYFVCVGFVPRFRNEWLLFLIVAPTIFLSDFSYDWFYVGIEDQIYITLRYIIIKIVQIVLIFLLIHHSSQYLLYAAISIGINSLSTIFNIVHLRKYIQFIPLQLLNVKRHLKSILIIFASLVATNMYMHIDVTMVGAMVGNEAVGIYVVPNRVVRIIIHLITSLGTVMIPRLENKLKNGDENKYYELLNRSLSFSLIFSIPSFFGVIATAKEIVLLFGGVAYAKAVLGMKLLSPILLFVPMAHFIGLQILYPHRMEGKYTISVSIASVTNILFNSFAIQKFQQNGAVIGTCLAEFVGVIIQVCFAWNFLKKTELFTVNTIKILVSGFCMFIMIMLFNCIVVINSIVIKLSITIVLAGTIYLFFLLLFREKMLFAIIHKKTKSL
ncbi:MAG: flippase [Treponema sp.]|nr:flippase [Treponema sp.]